MTAEPTAPGGAGHPGPSQLAAQDRVAQDPAAQDRVAQDLAAQSEAEPPTSHRVLGHAASHHASEPPPMPPEAALLDDETAGDLRSKVAEEPDIPALVTISSRQKVGEAIDLMQRYSISQLPVIRDGEVGSLPDVIGSLQDRDLLYRVFKNPDALHEDVVAAMQPPLAAIDVTDPLDEVFSTLSGRTNAVVVSQDGRPVGVLTRTDLLEYLAHNR